MRMSELKRYPISKSPNWSHQLMAKIMKECKKKQPCEDCILWNRVRNRCIVTDVTPDQWDVDLIAGIIHKQELLEGRRKAYQKRKVHI